MFSADSLGFRKPTREMYVYVSVNIQKNNATVTIPALKMSL
jgi:hypothetical protein